MKLIELIETEENSYLSSTAKDIYLLGERGTKIFPYQKAFDALKVKDDTGEWLYSAGMNWKWSQFPFEEALKLILQRDKSGKYINSIGTNSRKWTGWNEIEALKAFKNTPAYNKALEQVKIKGQHMMSNSGAPSDWVKRIKSI